MLAVCRVAFPKRTAAPFDESVEWYTQVLMALVEHDDDQSETVSIGLPALEFAAPFVGYEVTALSEKPVASLLIGDQNEFEKHFRFPTIKA
jgi:hypothetical protein